MVHTRRIIVDGTELTIDCIDLRWIYVYFHIKYGDDLNVEGEADQSDRLNQVKWLTNSLCLFFL